uniref:Uncharacterized protein n=1 Tax=Arundo donax TaxID=35708 RepID=A0A0A9CQL2_ARUDO
MTRQRRLCKETRDSFMSISRCKICWCTSTREIRSRVCQSSRSCSQCNKRDYSPLSATKGSPMECSPPMNISEIYIHASNNCWPYSPIISKCSC